MEDIAGSHLAVVLDHTCLLGEGPLWDASRQQICWIDIERGEIHQYSTKSKTHKTIPVHQMPGTIALCTDGNFIAALKNGIALIDRNSGEINILSNPEPHLPGNRFNDGKCDPAGRFWAGTLSLSWEAGAGSVYMWEKGFREAVKKIEHVTIPNGMAWSPDQQTFYFIDTTTHEVVAYRYDKASGNISHPKTVIHIPESEGLPDGMTIDTEGMLWIAHWAGWQVSRWDPNSGKKLLSIPLPVANVTSCTFGGNKLEDLYITTASNELTEEELKEQPLAGSLFVLRNSGFKGMPALEFGS